MARIVIEVEFQIGEEVYVKHDSEQLLRMVTGYTIRNINDVIYELSCANNASYFRGIEISRDKNVKML